MDFEVHFFSSTLHILSLFIRSNYLCFSYFSHYCDFCGCWTLRHIGLNPENLESFEGSKNENEFFGLQKHVSVDSGNFRFCQPNLESNSPKT